MKLHDYILGGRPMTKLDSPSFYDSVTNKNVYAWRDKLGRKWLAYDRWGWFRISAKEREL